MVPFMSRLERYRARFLAWLSVGSFQLKSTGVGVVSVAFMAIGFLVALVGSAFVDLDRRRTVIATISGFGTGGARNPSWIVTAQDAQGLTGSAGVRVDQIAGCQVGDKIRARQIGLTLRLDPAPCPVHLKPNESNADSAR